MCLQDDPSHPGFTFLGTEHTPGKKAYLIHLEAKPGKGDKVAQFLHDINDGVDKEPGTGPWFGTRFSETTFAIFEAFNDEAARQAHNVGPGGMNFIHQKELLHEMLSYPAQLYRLDVLHGKFGVLFGKQVSNIS